MDDALLVRGFERLGDLRAMSSASSNGRSRRSQQTVGERLALDQLHDERRAAVERPRAVDLAMFG